MLTASQLFGQSTWVEVDNGDLERTQGLFGQPTSIFRQHQDCRANQSRSFDDARTVWPINIDWLTTPGLFG